MLWLPRCERFDLTTFRFKLRSTVSTRSEAILPSSAPSTRNESGGSDT